METQEQKLLASLFSGNKFAAREVYNRFMPRLLNFIRLKIDNEHDVEEIAQDTMFAFLEGARDFEGKSRLNTYICAIARHKIADFYRKKRIKKIVFSQLPEGWENLFSELASPDVIFEDTMLVAKITQVFEKLTPIYRKLLHLKYVEGRGVAEIAQILTVSFKSTESMLFRARRAFVKIYEKPTVSKIFEQMERSHFHKTPNSRSLNPDL